MTHDNCSEGVALPLVCEVSPKKTGLMFKQMAEYFASSEYQPPGLLDDPFFQDIFAGKVPQSTHKWFTGAESIFSLDVNVDFSQSFKQSAMQGSAHFLKGSMGLYSTVYMDWVEPLAKVLKGKRVLEVGAGRTGLLAYALTLCGVDVIATDKMEEGLSPFSFVPVESLCYKEAIAKYASECDVLLSCWAPMGQWTGDITAKWKKARPDGWTVIVGETGGCTGSSKMFNALKKDAQIYVESIQGANIVRDSVRVFAPEGSSGWSE